MVILADFELFICQHRVRSDNSFLSFISALVGLCLQALDSYSVIDTKSEPDLD